MEIVVANDAVEHTGRKGSGLEHLSEKVHLFRLHPWVLPRRLVHVVSRSSTRGKKARKITVALESRWMQPDKLSNERSQGRKVSADARAKDPSRAGGEGGGGWSKNEQTRV